MFFIALRALLGAEVMVFCVCVWVYAECAYAEWVCVCVWVYAEWVCVHERTYLDSVSVRRLWFLHLALGVDVDEDLTHVGLHHQSPYAYLTQYVVDTVHVEYQVQLTDILKTPIERFNKYLGWRGQFKGLIKEVSYYISLHDNKC